MYTKNYWKEKEKALKVSSALCALGIECSVFPQAYSDIVYSGVDYILEVKSNLVILTVELSTLLTQMENIIDKISGVENETR